MNAKNPLVSIVIPCFNHEKFLEQTVHSVQKSRYRNIEVIIVNDGSTDKSEIVAQNLEKQFPEVRYYYQKNQGPSAARNTGITLARGELILPLDADDLISDEYIEKAVEVFRTDPEVKLVYCAAEKFGTKTGKWKLDNFSLEKLACQNMIFVSAFFKKDDWVKAGGFSEEMTWGFEDWEFWISLLKTGGKVVKLQHTGFYYRIQYSSRRKSVNRLERKKTVDFINRKHKEFIMKQLGGPLRYQKSLSKFINFFWND